MGGEGKVCPGCDRRKALTEFSPRKKGSGDGRASWCRDCTCAAVKRGRETPRGEANKARREVKRARTEATRAKWRARLAVLERRISA